MSTIRDIIYQLITKRMDQEEMYLVRGSVSNVSTDNWTCDVTPIDGGADIKGVRLKPTNQDLKGFVIVPKDGTKAVVGFESKTKAILLNADEVDQMILRNGENGGLINVSDLVDKLNALEDKVNDLILYTSTHTHTGVTTGGGTSGTSASPVTGSLTPTTVEDIEDDKITH